MEVILTCIQPEQAQILDAMVDEYKKFRNIEELPGDVYGALYWLARYSKFEIKQPMEEGKKLLNPVIMEFGKFREICRWHGNFCGETGMMCTHLKCPYVKQSKEVDGE